jgi:non-ribosomal peptide synthetase component F
MSLLAGYEIMMSRYSRQEEMVIGTPIAKRDRAEIEGVMGLFVNTVVMRADLRGNPTYREMLKRVREETVGALGHQDVPFEKVVEELRPERDLSHNPLFQVWFVLQNASDERLDMAGLKLTSIGLNRAETRHDLQLSLWETADGLRGSLEYRTDLFNSGTITKMARSFETILECALAHPDAPLSALEEMLDAADKQQQVIREKQVEENALRRFKSTRRKAISGS